MAVLAGLEVMVVQVLCVQIQSPENFHHMEMGGLDIFRCVVFFFYTSVLILIFKCFKNDRNMLTAFFPTLFSP